MSVLYNIEEARHPFWEFMPEKQITFEVRSSGLNKSSQQVGGFFVRCFLNL